MPSEHLADERQAENNQNGRSDREWAYLLDSFRCVYSWNGTDRVWRSFYRSVPGRGTCSLGRSRQASDSESVPSFAGALRPLCCSRSLEAESESPSWGSRFFGRRVRPSERRANSRTRLTWRIRHRWWRTGTCPPGSGSTRCSRVAAGRRGWSHCRRRKTATSLDPACPRPSRKGNVFQETGAWGCREWPECEWFGSSPTGWCPWSLDSCRHKGQVRPKTTKSKLAIIPLKSQADLPCSSHFPSCSCSTLLRREKIVRKEW